MWETKGKGCFHLLVQPFSKPSTLLHSLSNQQSKKLNQHFFLLPYVSSDIIKYPPASQSALGQKSDGSWPGQLTHQPRAKNKEEAEG